MKNITKKLQFLLVVILLSFIKLQSQECEILPYTLADNEFFQSIYFIDKDFGYVSIGDDVKNKTGKLIFTKDGGLNWTKYSFANCSEITSIYFEDSNNGYIKTDNRNVSYITNNGGLNWHKAISEKEQQPSNQSQDNHLINNYSDVEFSINTFVGHEILAKGIDLTEIHETADGITDVISIFLIDEQISFRLRKSKLEKTINGGKDWSNISSTVGKKISFINSNVGFLLSNESDDSNKGIYKTINQGLNWELIQFDKSLSILDYDFINESLGYIITQHKIYKVKSKTVHTTKNNLENSIKIFPNPTSTFFNLKSDSTVISKYSLFDIFGKKVLENSFSGNVKIDISDLSKGMYFLKIDNTDYCAKIIKI